MHYKSLYINNFRSYREYVVELSPGVNIVVGPNASGKTNMLEAILTLSSGSSFRAKDRDLIAWGNDWSSVRGVTDQGIERAVKLRSVGPRIEKLLKVEDKEFRRIDKRHLEPVTLFEPEHMKMVHGSPEKRREYLDGILVQTEAMYQKFLRDYKRVLSQRNKLLKANRPVSHDELFVWNLKLSDLGSYIVENRLRLIEQINTKTNQIYSRLSGKPSKLKVGYKCSVGSKDYASAALKSLQENIDTDRRVGFTSVGPHRDDVWFELNGQPALSTASRGENRTIVLGCKLIELGILEESHSKTPILLLDDVFSELDSSRRQHITKYLEKYQTVITTTDADAILKHFIGDYKIIPT